MSKQKTTVRWSPHDPSLFAVGSDDLRLYQVVFSKRTYPASNTPDKQAKLVVPTQRKRSFRMLNFTAEVPLLRCVDWNPDPSQPFLLAAGLGSGKLVLTDFGGPEVSNDVGPKIDIGVSSGDGVRTRKSSPGPAAVLKEFVPKFPRPCNAVAWNDKNWNQVAVGLEKVRSDHCTLIWDINYMGDSGSNLSGAGQLPSSASSVTKPIAELANSEATVALSWLPQQPTCLAIGTGFKWLRIHDLRSPGSPMSIVAHAKTVQGVVCDGHRPFILATYSDSPQDVIKVWDVRRLESNSAVVTIRPTSKNITQILWSPSRPGVLASSSLDERWISFWDVLSSLPPEDDVTNHPSRSISGTSSFSSALLQTNASGSLSASSSSSLLPPNSSSVLTKPFHRRYAEEPIVSFSWQSTVSGYGVTAAFPNRLLIGTASAAASSCSPGKRKNIPEDKRQLTTLEWRKLMVLAWDVSLEMLTLARKGYSMDVQKSLTIFAMREQEEDSVEKTLPTEATFRRRQLLHVWTWVDRVERLCEAKLMEKTGKQERLNSFAKLVDHWNINSDGLRNAGIEALLLASGPSTMPSLTDSANQTLPPRLSVSSSINASLGCEIYDSWGRRLSLIACGWDPELFPLAPSSSLSPPTSSSERLLQSIKSSMDGEDERNEESLDIVSTIKALEQKQLYDRAAALAVFHCDFRGAVSTLHRGAASLRQQASIAASSPPAFSPSPFQASGTATNFDKERKQQLLARADLYDLVGMAIAGYSPVNDSNAGSRGQLWREKCQELCQRPEVEDGRRPRYLRAILSFLTTLHAMKTSQGPNRDQRLWKQSWRSAVAVKRDGTNPLSQQFSSSSSLSSYQPFKTILYDQTLALSDRIAFACRFLPADDLQKFVEEKGNEGVERGALEGLIITGLNSRGLRLLQTYVNSTADIQTAALLVARLNSTSDKSKELADRWFLQYQELLNRWQLWKARALLDVQRSQLLMKRKSFDETRSGGGERSDSSSSTRRGPGSSDGTQVGEKGSSGFSLPQQLYVRCNYCASSLSLTALLRSGGSHATWLGKSKPKLSCCPSCRKPLPRCALCLMSLGSLNPYVELQYRKAKQHDAQKQLGLPPSSSSSSSTVPATGASSLPVPPSTSQEELMGLLNIPFVEWWTWCQNCKHGGHAHHLAQWFTTHDVCPVSNCNCTCKRLDGPVIKCSLLQEGERDGEGGVHLAEFLARQPEPRHNLGRVPADDPMLRRGVSDGHLFGAGLGGGATSLRSEVVTAGSTIGVPFSLPSASSLPWSIEESAAITHDGSERP